MHSLLLQPNPAAKKPVPHSWFLSALGNAEEKHSCADTNKEMVHSPPSVTGIALRQSWLGEFCWNCVLLKYAVPLQSSRLAERDGSARVLFGKKNEGSGGEVGLSKHPILIALK